MRRTNTVVLCTVDRSSSSDGGTVTYTRHSIEPKTCATIWRVKVPINKYNVVFQEVFEEYSCSNKKSSKIFKLNFLTLCVNSIDTLNNSIDFETYQHVKIIEFAGHIGSMKVAFELLYKLPSVRQVVFCIAVENVKCENKDFMQYTNDDIKEVANVDKLKIWASFKGESHMDLQMGEKTWRLDEIFRLSRLAIPCVRHLEINLSGNGNTYEKVQKFINDMPCLKGNYSAKIGGGSLTVLRQPASVASAGLSRHMDKINTTVTSNALQSIKDNYKPEKLEEMEQRSESSSEHNLHLSTPKSSSNAEGSFNINPPPSLVPRVVEGTIGAGSYQSISEVKPSCTEKTVQGTGSKESEDKYYCKRETMAPSALSMDSDGDLRLMMSRKRSQPMPKAPPPPVLTPGFRFSKSAVHEPGGIDLSNRWTYRENTSTETTTSGNRDATGSDEPEEPIDTKAKKIKHISETSSERNLLRSSHSQGSNHSRRPLSPVSSTEEMEINPYPSNSPSHGSNIESTIKRKRTTEEENQYYQPKQLEREIMEPQALAVNLDEDLRKKLSRMRDPLPPRRTAPLPPSLTTRRIISRESAGYRSRDRNLNNQRQPYRENWERTKTVERKSNREPFGRHEAESPIPTNQSERIYIGREKRDNYEPRSRGLTSSSWRKRSYESRESDKQSSYDNRNSQLPYNNMYRGGERDGGRGRGGGRVRDGGSGRGRGWDGLRRGGGCANQY